MLFSGFELLLLCRRAGMPFAMWKSVELALGGLEGSAGICRLPTVLLLNQDSSGKGTRTGFEG